MKNKTLAIILSFFSVFFVAYAQQDSQYTQYMYNTENINSAYTGTKGVFTGVLLHRNQWVGLDGAPVTNTIAINTPINNTSFSIGLSVINDEIGPAIENTFTLNMAYGFSVTDNSKVSLGINGTINFLDIDFNRISRYSNNDVVLSRNVDKKFSPNMGVGVYWYSDKAYLGLSVPNIFETTHFKEGTTFSNSSVAKERMHYHLIAGRVFDVSSSIKFKPALLVKYVKGTPLQLDVSANFLFNEKFTIGTAYRWSAAYSALLGFKISDSFSIGYAYDREVTKLVNYTSGSHEVFIRYELIKKEGKFISPRFF